MINTFNGKNEHTFHSFEKKSNRDWKLEIEHQIVMEVALIFEMNLLIFECS